LWLGRSCIIASPAAHSCRACFVAGEPGGGASAPVSLADAPPVGVWKCRAERGRAGACVQAAGGCEYGGCAAQSALASEEGREPAVVELLF